MSQARNMKTCIVCGKSFIVPGSCRDYLYKHGSTYYCSYNHWTAAAIEAEAAKAKAHASSTNERHGTNDAFYCSLAERSEGQ